MKHLLSYVLVTLSVLVVTVGAAGAQEGRAWGDIHVRTMDGATYEFQRSGEFVASGSTAGDFEVQLRLEPAGFPSHVSIATAIGVQVDSTRVSVALGRDPELFVDGRPAKLDDGAVELPDGGWIERSQRGYEVLWSDGSSLSIDVRKRHLNAFLRPAEDRRGTLSGLFGNFNGNPADDVEASIAKLTQVGGSRLEAGLVADLVGGLLGDEDEASWVTREESLFEYEPGQTTASFRRPKPAREASSAALPASRRRHAQEVCRQAGVTDPALLEACVLDVGYTRDESFAETAAAVQARDGSSFDAEAVRRAGR